LVAEQRASAVRQQLISRGVESSRLTTITATVPVYGAGTAPRDVDPKLRRVLLRVLVRKQAGSAR
jgi:outer membrane protein OmpA-like peptidoglycan-associated protein